MYLVKNSQNFCEVFFSFFQFYHLGISVLNQRDFIMQKSPIFICRECVFNKISILLKMQYKLFTTLIHLEFYILYKYSSSYKMQNLKSPAIHTNYTTNHEFSKYTYGVATKYDYKFKMLINDTMYFCILYLSNFYVPSVFIVWL